MTTSKSSSSKTPAPRARKAEMPRESMRVPRPDGSEQPGPVTDPVLRAAFELLPQPSAIGRLHDGVLVEANAAFLKVLGLTREQLLGRGLPDLDPRHALTSTRFEAGAEAYVLHVLETAWIDRVPVGLWIARDREARVIERNRAALALSRMTDRNAQPRYTPYADGVPQAWEEQPLVRAATSGSAIHDFEQELRFEGGGRAFLRGSALPLLDALGQPCGAILAAVDVTAIKQSEAALRQTDRRKDDFLAVLSHELRNPLGAILTALQLMQQRGEELHAHEREVIQRQAQHLTRMVDDLLDISRITRGKLELSREQIELGLPLSKALEATAQLFEQRRQERSVSLPERGLLVNADELRLTQIFTNLLSNAARYTPQGGHIHVSAQREGEHVVTRVRDDGIGIDPSQLATIFELFVQGERAPDRAGSGLGVGLALVRALTRLHGGTAEAHSAGVGQGSELVVSLPLAAASRTRPLQAASASSYKSERSRRVLVVDDNEDAADMLAALLTAAGHELHVASDPVEALAIAAFFEPEVALLDIGLPVMDGYALGQNLREQRGAAHAPVLIALTGYGQEHDRQRSQAAGFAHHLVKPVNTEALLQLLDALPTP